MSVPAPRSVPSPSPEIAAILETYTENMRAAILDLRAAILAIVPEATDTISYALPALRYRGRSLVCYGAWRNHVAFYPMSGELVERHAPELRAYSLAKGTIRFTPDRPLQRDVVDAIVRARVAQIDAKVSKEAND